MPMVRALNFVHTIKREGVCFGQPPQQQVRAEIGGWVQFLDSVTPVSTIIAMVALLMLTIMILMVLGNKSGV